MSDSPARVIDADNHYYETYDCFTRHIEREFADQTVRIVPDNRGLGRIYVGQEKCRHQLYIPGDYTSAPGALLGAFEGKMEGGYQQTAPINSHDFPDMMNREARLTMMDSQGIEAIVQLPTLAVAVEQEMVNNPDLTYASLRAFNRWIEDEWGYDYQDRIFAVPLMSLLDVDQAVLELDRVLALGARLVHLKPGPQNGRSPADPVYDPFWARINEAGIPVAFHISNSGYNQYYGRLWSEDPDNANHRQSALQWAICQTERPIVDTLFALVLHNLFGRFPNITVLSVENGSDWVAPTLKMLDKAVGLGRNGPMLGGPLPGRASETFKQHVRICPFPEDDVTALIDIVGADAVLFGSDYPHPEGIAVPLDFRQRLNSYDKDTIEKIMFGNSAGLLHIS